MRGLVTLGDLALFYQAFNQGQSLLRSILGNLSQVYSNSLFLGDLFEFLALEPQVVDPVAPRPFPEPDAGPIAPVLPATRTVGPSICFRSVGFRYPGNGRPILENLNLEIGAGQTAAIVGPNGAGKSTLIKLLCRLYDPSTGEIELGGTNLRDLPVETLRQHMSVLFQEPVQFNASAAENIAMGNGTEHREDIEAAARAAGADGPIERLRDGYDTLLGTWFDGGTDLSVGEWQRIALARAFLRRAPVVVLDEPTSAMDAWAEADWLSRFRDILRGSTTIMITHRFTSARHADIIFVMDGGCIVEAGTHEQLLERNGRYAQGWRSQVAAGDGHGALTTGR